MSRVSVLVAVKHTAESFHLLPAALCRAGVLTFKSQLALQPTDRNFTLYAPATDLTHTPVLLAHALTHHNEAVVYHNETTRGRRGRGRGLLFFFSEQELQRTERKRFSKWRIRRKRRKKKKRSSSRGGGGGRRE